jgi:formylglycine-generating enzyme required for sulfatase activity
VKSRRNEIVATQRTNDVLSLSAIQELKDLVARADALWPATPARVPDFDRWLADASLLVDGRRGDPARGVESRPGLKDHEAKLAELRARAKPIPPERVEADRRASEDFPKLEAARGKLLWMRRMAGLEPWPETSDAQAELEKETLPESAVVLDRMAWTLVDIFPTTIVYGSEVKGLLLARAAAAAADDPEQLGVRRTLALALFRCGRLDEALAEARREVERGKPETKEDAQRALAILEEEVGRWRESERPKREKEMREVAASVAELEASVNRRSTFEFEDTKDRWWHDQLAQLVRGLKAFSDERSGLDSKGMSAAHGWGIGKRRDAATTIEERTKSGAEAKRRWEEAIASIRDRSRCPRYDGLEIPPQFGLLPIGRDPASGLWEFAHVETGEPAERGAQGALEMRDETGLVFVLIPGGIFKMGAQKTDPAAPHYDPQANPDEGPVQDVTLSPFFLSKYEMTQGQWSRFTANDPSLYGPGMKVASRMIGLANPVEQVTWIDCEETLRRLDLELPTEAQWEYAARAGTDTVFWTGDDKATISGAANIADGYSKRNGGPEVWQFDEWLDDGHSVHAPAGTFRPNAFGLHEMIGNVWEWCRDGYGTYALPPRAGDGERIVPGALALRVYRGGSFSGTSAFARSANRGSGTPDYRDCSAGVRPERALRP